MRSAALSYRYSRGIEKPVRRINRQWIAHCVPELSHGSADRPIPVSQHGGPGVDKLRFIAPVRPGDTITVSVEVLDVKPSRSKPDRGMMRLQHRGFNQHGDEVIRFTGYCVKNTKYVGTK